MATIHCACKNSFSDSQFPSPNGYTLISEENLELILDSIQKLISEEKDIDAQLPFLLRNQGSEVYKCPYCSRLIVFENGPNNAATFYINEEIAAKKSNA